MPGLPETASSARTNSWKRPGPSACLRLLAMSSRSRSHVTKNRWRADEGLQTAPSAVVGRTSAFSSKGPTRDGREKPEVSAPGEMITAALASESEEADDGERANTADRTLTIEGTSMAAPYVAGVIALMLQQRPTLGPAEIIDIIKATSRKDEHTGPSSWTPEYGHGKMSALAAVNLAGQTGSSTPIAASPASLDADRGAARSAVRAAKRARTAKTRSRRTAKRKK